MRNAGWLVVLLLCGACDAFSFEGSLFPTEENSQNCVINPEACAKDETCDHVKKRCISSSGTCVNTGSCIAESAAFCNAGLCVGCNALAATSAEGDLRCEEWSTQRGNQANLCIGGVCKECRSNADCRQPGKRVCDLTRNTCVSCTEDSQCLISNICKRDSSLLATNDSKDNIGDCVAPGEIAYVDKTNISCSNDALDSGTVNRPFCQIKQAILQGNSYIRVQNGSEYDPIVVDQSKRVNVYGMGRMATSLLSARVTTSASLTIQDIAVNAAMMNPNIVSLIKCDLGASLVVRRSLLIGRDVSQGGIVAEQCYRVIVERTRIEQISGNGISIHDGSNHFVVNNAILLSGTIRSSMQDRFGLRIGPNITNSTFAFNTISSNLQGVLCESNKVGITDSIVQQNIVPPEVVGCVILTNVVTTGAVIDTTQGNDPRILMDTSNVGDKANANPLVYEDYFGNPRPLGRGYDIGFHEYK